MAEGFFFSPIAYFRSERRSRYEVAHQGIFSHGFGQIELVPEKNFEQAMIGLEGFERIWLVFLFHKNLDRASAPPVMVKPPRLEKKMGVFATRSPHRPNPIGMTPARLLDARGKILKVAEADLLDGTPILDIKPYLPFADAFPKANSGWVTPLEKTYKVHFSPLASEQIAKIASEEDLRLDHYAEVQLQIDPSNTSRKRIRVAEKGLVLDFRSWSLHFMVEEHTSTVRVLVVEERKEDPPCA